MTPEELQHLIDLQHIREVKAAQAQAPTEAPADLGVPQAQPPQVPNAVPQQVPADAPGIAPGTSPNDTRVQQLQAIQQGGAYGAPPSDAIPQVSPQDIATPYNQKAEDFNKQAAGLEQQAAQTRPQPQGWRETLVAAARAAMENYGRYGAPGGYYGQEDKRQAQFNTENAARTAQAKEYRTLGEQQSALGQTATRDANTENYQQGQLANVKQAQAEMRARQTEVDRRDAAKEAAAAEAARQPKYTPVQPGQPVMKTIPGQEPSYSTAPGEKPDTQQGTIGEYNYYLKTLTPGQKAMTFSEYQDADANRKKVNTPNPMQIIQSETGPVRVSTQGPEGPVQVGGENVKPKRAEAPVQLKNQANAAKTTKDMVGIVRSITSAHPEYLGMAKGALENVMLKAGGDPDKALAALGAIPANGETDIATLAGHLAYLFLNEARATMPGRPAAEFMRFVKDRSAQIGQSPQVMEGYLRSAENNANITLKNAAAVGYDPFGIGAQAPAAGGAGSFIKPGGALEKLLQGNK